MTSKIDYEVGVSEKHQVITESGGHRSRKEIM
jgi:hypothetical protein